MTDHTSSDEADTDDDTIVLARAELAAKHARKQERHQWCARGVSTGDTTSILRVKMRQQRAEKRQNRRSAKQARKAARSTRARNKGVLSVEPT
jgi:hypothetical protein